jgi:hypothetical protein
MHQNAHWCIARKYLRRHDNPRWRLWDVFVTLRIKIGSIPGKNIKNNKYSASRFKGWHLVYSMPLDDKMLTKFCSE